jgi:hypothetical protein
MGARCCAFRLWLCLFAIVPAACGGGGGGSSALPGTSSPIGGGSSAAPAAVNLTIAIPSASSSSSLRRVRYVSAGTKSVSVSFSGSRQTADCAATCSLTLQVMPGAVTFVAALYDQPGAVGNVLATGQTTATIVAGTQSMVKLAFGGVVAKVTLSLAQGTVSAGTPSAIPLTVSAQDAAGFTIVGPEAYATPIGLSNDDASGATSLSTTSVADPTVAVTLRYNGSTGFSAAHIGATLPGTAIGVVPATLSAQSPPPPAPQGNVPAHAATWYYYAINHVNESIPATWMAAHADYVEDDGYAADHAEAFKDAGGKYAVAYTDPAYVPYCYAPFVAPVKPCDGPIGNHVTDESAWFHGPDGGRVHHFVSNEFQYQEALNPASPAARDAYTAYTQHLIAHSPKVDYFLADDTGGTFTGPDGTPLTGRFYGYNAAGVEITSDAQFIPANQQMLAAAARPVFVNGYDVATRLPSYNGVWLDSKNVAGNEIEGCFHYTDNGTETIAGDKAGKWAGNSNGLLAVIAHRSLALCMMTAPATPSNRIYMMASWWMTYTEPYSIAAPEGPTPDGFTVRPEYDIVPRQPRTTATTDVAALRSATGAYVREFAACYQAGTPIGPCAAVVNASSSPVAMPSLSVTYSRTLAVDDRSAYTGGQASWTATVPSQLAPLSAVVLR